MRSSESLDEEAMNRSNDERGPQRAGEDRYRREHTPEYLRSEKQDRHWVEDNDPDSDDPD